MSQVTYTLCDTCKVAATPEVVKRYKRISVSIESADVCSLECAQVWIAEQFEAQRFASEGAPLLNYLP